MSDAPLPASADVVIVGTGAAGMSAAIRFRKRGLAPILIEKTAYFGGSTAVSGGAVWIPGNPHSEGVGHKDSKEAAKSYLAAEMGNRMNSPLVDAFLDTGPEVVRFLESETEVRFAARALGPDYHPDLPGGTLGGRVMDPADYDSARLGPALRRLRPPIPEFTILGGMMVGRTDLGMLPKMARSPKAFAYTTRVVLRHLKEKLTHGRATRSVLGNALAARLGKTVHDLGIPIFYDTALTGLERDATGRAAAVRVTCKGQSHRITARHGILLAAGGFPHDATRRAGLLDHAKGGAHYSMSPANNTGDTITAAQSTGARIGEDNSQPAFFTPVSRLKRPDGTEASFPHLFLDRAKPGLIAVTDKGTRFVNESASYHDFVSAMIEAMKDGATAFWLIADHRFVRRYGLGIVRPFPGRIAPWLRNGYLSRAADIPALARAIDLPPDALKTTITRTNAHAAKGEDPDFGKGATAYNRYLGDPEHTPNPCLRPIDQGPYYALRVYPGDIGTSTGLVTNEHAQVLGMDGAPIVGLYAAGNDMNSIMAGTYPGPGITLGPALTFGYIAANHIADQAASTG